MHFFCYWQDNIGIFHSDIHSSLLVWKSWFLACDLLVLPRMLKLMMMMLIFLPQKRRNITFYAFIMLADIYVTK